MAEAAEIEFKGMARPGKETLVADVGDIYVLRVMLDGAYFEYRLFSEDNLIFRGEANINFADPLRATRLLLKVTGPETIYYHIICAPAKD